MANRPNRNRTVTKKKKTQSEINRIKPAGVLTFEALAKKSTNIKTINVELPDGEIQEFYHLPMTIDQAEEFFDTIGGDDKTVADVIHAKKVMLTNQMVNKDGTPFAQSVEDWGPIDTQIVTALVDAIMMSGREDGPED